MNPITIRCHVNATPETAWDYFSNPKYIVQWNFASPDWCCPRAENDLRVGGSLKSRMEAKDGSMGFDFEGVYDEVNPFKSIKYHLEDGRNVQIIFEATGSGTEVTEIFDPEGQHPLEMQQAGWQAILDNYAALVNSNQ